ncbi:lipopolysaccharide biosynthesis protein [Prescottella subtropica]|uniref:lipopolysaccharide biosynthesis protein n=1 Tax=Prescottella subtropica TaxID=2545757 RepID=UPI0010F6A084|nr:hypothetical protein [Prescottella subtropica]
MTEKLARRPRGGSKLYVDAASMASAQVLNAALGMAFWAVAALLLSPAELGVMTALLALVTAPAQVIGTGIGDAYSAVMPAAGSALSAVYRSGQRIFLGVALPVGVLAGVAGITMLPDVRLHWSVGALVLVGVVVWGLFVLQNSTLASLGRAGTLPLANGLASAGRIVVLVALAAWANWQPIVVATIVSGAVAVAVLHRIIGKTVVSESEGVRAGRWTAPEAVRELTRLCTQTIPAQTLSIGVLLLLPFLVTVYAGPAQGAVFALSMSIVQALEFVGSSMGTSLVVHASRTPAESSSMALVLFVRVAVLVAAGGVALSLAAPFVFGILDPEYLGAGAQLVVILLSVASLIRTVFVVWAALQRSRRDIAPLLRANALFAVVLMIALAPLTLYWGAIGAACALVVAQAVASTAAVRSVARRRDDIRKQVFRHEV